jgi:hypothetical protein
MASPRSEKGAEFWPIGGTEPVKVKRSFTTQRSNRSSHAHIISPLPLDAGRRQESPPSAPFGTDVDNASDTAGSGGRLKLLVDGGARCVEVRAKSTSAGNSTHERPIAQRNVLTGQGDIETHAASAHLTSTLSGGAGLSDLSLRKVAPGEGARKHLHTDRNVITGDGICERTDLHTASGHLAGVGSGSHEAARGGLRKQASRRAGAAPDTGAEPGSPTRNVLLGHGVSTHHQSAHLTASASGLGHRVYRESPKLRRDPLRSSASDLLHHDDQAPPATHVTGWAENTAAVRPTSSQTGRRVASNGHSGGDRPF